MEDTPLETLAGSANYARHVSSDQSVNPRRYTSLTLGKLEVLKNLLAASTKTIKISEALGVSSRTIQRWAKALDHNPFQVPNKKGRKKADSSAMKTQLEAIVASDCSLTGKGIIDHLPDDMKCSASTVSRNLKAMMFTRKRLKTIVSERNSAWVITARSIYATHMSNIPDADLVFIDETGFNLHTSAGYGYAPIGETPWINVPTQRGRNVSLIAAISISGILSFSIVSGAFNTLRMVQWCQESLLPSIMGRRVVFVMDNASFHHSTTVAEVMTSNGSRIQFLPPYSPQINPIEQVFSCVKSRFKAHRPRPASQDELQEIIQGIMDGLRETSMMAYYCDMRQWLVKAQQRLAFI
jgi:transposase